ncbi:MAG: hypothetical protein R6V85_10550 [Polyangia bacterium]
MKTIFTLQRISTAPVAAVLLVTALWTGGCYNVRDSQRYFRDAAAEDTSLEMIHQTALYTVYFDHALRRCILHSAHTWGERGGGGGGTGVGVTAFRCDPNRIRDRIEQIDLLRERGRRPEVSRSPARGTIRDRSSAAMRGGEETGQAEKPRRDEGER